MDLGDRAMLRRTQSRTTSRRLGVVLTFAALGLSVTACGNSDADSGAKDTPVQADEQIPNDALLADYCYAINGIDLDDGAPPNLIQERIDLLAKTGAPADAPVELHSDIEWLVEWVRDRGDQVTVSDHDAVELDAAREAPSPYDDPERALRGYGEENCDGVYTEDFSAEGQGEDEDVLDNLLWERNQILESGECAGYAELYTQDSAVDPERCEAGEETPYDLVGGGVTGPDTADLLVETPDGEQLSVNGVKEGETWKLAVY